MKRRTIISCTIDGVHYKNMVAASNALGISYYEMRHRLASFDFPNYISDKIPKKLSVSYKTRENSCTIDGIEYNSISSASRELGIPYYEMRHRLASFDYPDYICQRRPKKPSAPYKKRNRICIIDGVEYRSMTAAFNALGISENGLRYRLRSPNFPGYISEQHPKKNHRALVSCTIEGVGYKSIKVAAKDIGISYYEMKRRLASLDYPDYTSDKIPKKPPVRAKRKGRPCIIDGVHYKTISAASKALGISGPGLAHRLCSPNFPGYISKYYIKKEVGFGVFVSCTIDGVHYPSVSAAARDLGIPYGKIIRRLTSFKYPDYVCANIPGKSSPSSKRGHSCTIDGVHYPSVSAAARDLGMPSIELRIRSSNFPGYISKRYKKVKRGKLMTPKRCTIKGVEYVSINAAAKKLKIKNDTISNRLRSFDFPDYICDEYPKKPPKKRHPCTIDGVEYKSIRSASRDLGISCYEIKCRLAYFDFPNYVCDKIPKKAHAPYKNSGNLCTINGVEYKSIPSASKVLGIPYGKIRRRLASFDFPNYMCDTIPKKVYGSHKSKKKSCTIDGVHYPSIYAASKAFGTRETVIMRRIRSSNFPGYVSKHYPKVKRRMRIAPKRCTIKGVEYVSINAAVRKLKIQKDTLSNRLRSSNFPDYVCADIPKKPSKPLK